MKIRLKDKESFNEILMKRGYTKASLGQEISLSQTMISQIANGIRNPSPRTAKKIIDVLDLGFDDIFTIQKNNEQREVTN